MTARGFIETTGLLAAIEAADAMVKAADVRLIGKNLVGGGLVTITVAGEVSAVRASVDAAVTAVRCIDGAALVSQHVIARPYEEVFRIIVPEKSSMELEIHPVVEVEVETKASGQFEASGIVQENEDIEVQKKVVETPEVEVDPAPKLEPKRYTLSELTKTTVSRLRQIALEMSDISLTREEIRTATKRKLIETIFNVTNR